MGTGKPWIICALAQSEFELAAVRRKFSEEQKVPVEKSMHPSTQKQSTLKCSPMVNRGTGRCAQVPLRRLRAAVLPQYGMRVGGRPMEAMLEWGASGFTEATLGAQLKR